MVTKLTLPSKENAVQEKVNEIIDNLGGGVDIDNTTITENASNKLQASGVINPRDGNSIKIWQGSEAQWNQGEPTTWYYWQTSVTAMWTASTLPSSASWWAVTYGDGKFVAVANNSDTSAYFITYTKCYTDAENPTTASIVYSSPETSSALTITSVGTGTITLSDTNTYSYTPSGNQFTYRTIGDAHPDWLCFINGVGVKIGNTIIATNS